MIAWLLKASGGEPSEIHVAIETPHGPIVEALPERGFNLYSINPKQLDRFRDRFTVGDLHPLLLAGLPTHTAFGTVRSCSHMQQATAAPGGGAEMKMPSSGKLCQAFKAPIPALVPLRTPGVGRGPGAKLAHPPPPLLLAQTVFKLTLSKVLSYD